MSKFTADFMLGMLLILEKGPQNHCIFITKMFYKYFSHNSYGLYYCFEALMYYCNIQIKLSDFVKRIFFQVKGM